MSFEDVRRYLLEHLVPALSSSLQELAKTWIEELEPADESDLLATSIAIDLKSEALLPAQLEPVFREMSHPFGSPRRAFAEAMDRCSSSLQMQSRNRAENALESLLDYANVLDLTAFLQCYVIPSYPYLTPDDLERAKSEFFAEESGIGGSAERSLEEIVGTFEGPDGLVWVGPDTVYRRRTNELDEDAATLLHDILGLGETWRGEMVYIKYPPGFKPEGCSQPTTLDQHWDRAGGCYLSAAEGDGWGRTHSRSGSEESMPVPERIHGPLGRLNEEFGARLLTEPEVVPRNVDALRASALQRFGAIRERNKTP